MEMENLTPAERETMNLLANSGMNVSRAAEILGCSRKAVYDRIRTVRNKTGKDPTDFWDLHDLITNSRFYRKEDGDGRE